MFVREDERGGLDRDRGRLDPNARARLGKIVGMVVLTMAVILLLAALALQQVAQMKRQGLLPTTADPHEFTSAILKQSAPSRARSRSATIGDRKRQNDRRPKAAGREAGCVRRPVASGDCDEIGWALDKDGQDS